MTRVSIAPVACDTPKPAAIPLFAFAQGKGVFALEGEPFSDRTVGWFFCSSSPSKEQREPNNTKEAANSIEKNRT